MCLIKFVLGMNLIRFSRSRLETEDSVRVRSRQISIKEGDNQLDDRLDVLNRFTLVKRIV